MYHRGTVPAFKTTPSYQVRSQDQTPLVDEAEQRRRSIPTTAYSDQAPALQAVQPSLGPQPANDRLYHPELTTLVMKDKALSLREGAFSVRTVSGEEVVRCKVKRVSLHGRKTITDTDGVEIYTLSTQILAVHKAFRADSPNHRHGFDVECNFQLAGSKPRVAFENAADGEHIILDIFGEWRSKAVEIRLGDRVVASIGTMFFDPRDFFGEKQTYFVAVAPNVDLSLIIGVCVCLEEKDSEASG